MASNHLSDCLPQVPAAAHILPGLAPPHPPTPCRGRAWKTNLLLVAQAVLFICLIWAVDKAGG
jgi:hypothetical protein